MNDLLPDTHTYRTQNDDYRTQNAKYRNQNGRKSQVTLKQANLFQFRVEPLEAVLEEKREQRTRQFHPFVAIEIAVVQFQLPQFTLDKSEIQYSIHILFTNLSSSLHTDVHREPSFSKP